MHYRFQCGCSFPVLAKHPNPNALPLLDFHINDIDVDCPATWELLGHGLTKGVFQLESNLGRTWTKKLKPEDMEHLAALGALLRPGCLRAIDEHAKCSMTELYCRRKNGQAPVEYIHPCLEKVLAPTFGVLTYQEQAMQIAQVVAGFNLQAADELRKAIGKKLPEEMAKVKVKFFEGVAKLGLVTLEQATEIFGWIEKSQRYSFNKSHALSYGINGYISAWLKAHMPVQFFTSWLYYAKDKQDPQQEIRELVSDAKILDVVVQPPDIRNLEAHFSTDGETITFGISDVKGIGEAQVEKLKTAVHETSQFLGKPIENWSWYEFLVHLTPKLSNTVVNNMIKVGGLRHFGNNRNLMLKEYEFWDALTASEQTWIVARSANNYVKQTQDEIAQTNLFGEAISIDKDVTLTSLAQAMEKLAPTRKEGGGTFKQSRKEAVSSMLNLLKNPPTKIIDTPDWIAWSEESLLGISLTCSKVDACDTSMSNCTCKEYLAGRTGYMVFSVEILAAKEIKVKNGQQVGRKMAFLTVADNTCSVEMTCFPEQWKEYSSLLNQGNTVNIQAERDRRKDSLIVKRVYQI